MPTNSAWAGVVDADEAGWILGGLRVIVGGGTLPMSEHGAALPECSWPSAGRAV
jgi:hypothetical protein